MSDLAASERQNFQALHAYAHARIKELEQQLTTLQTRHSEVLKRVEEEIRLIPNPTGWLYSRKASLEQVRDWLTGDLPDK